MTRRRAHGSGAGSSTLLALTLLATSCGDSAATVPAVGGGTGGSVLGMGSGGGAAAMPMGTGALPAASGGTGATTPAGTGAAPGGAAGGLGGISGDGGTGSGGVPLPSGGTSGVSAGGSFGRGGSPIVDGSEGDYLDPGAGAWQVVSPEECGLDATKLDDGNVGTYAIFRYGKLCHMKGLDTAGSMFSVTKTLGGTMVGRAAYLTRDVPRTGPGTGTILHEDAATDWLGLVSYNSQATLSHVMAMVAHNPSLAYDQKSFSYDTIGSVQINTMIDVTEAAIAQVPGLPTSAVAFVEQEIFDKMGMTSSSWSPLLGISSGWTANLSDMGKLGTLLLHDGWYGGERLLAREWVYRMSHPAFEDANTSYGQLAWLNHRGNADGIGGNITSGANAPEGDPCAPAAFWPEYPHGLSEAPDCLSVVGSCDQQYDVGVFSAQGLNGQFIVMHPGLDMVIAARNFSGGDGPLGLWRAVRPALVAMDPVYQGDEAAFCEAYGAGNYAPDLPVSRHP